MSRTLFVMPPLLLQRLPIFSIAQPVYPARHSYLWRVSRFQKKWEQRWYKMDREGFLYGKTPQVRRSLHDLCCHHFPSYEADPGCRACTMEGQGQPATVHTRLHSHCAGHVLGKASVHRQHCRGGSGGQGCYKGACGPHVCVPNACWLQ